MPEFHITWEIDLAARSEADAARKALAIQRDPGSWATVYTVRGDDRTVFVDLDPEHLDPGGSGRPKIILAV
ncbi:hypothetical protein AB0E82_39560 [Streptomyces anulatus]|uniref:hypothetical protein n=1 Tax=Streptomyces anulatus TaxID=1892 RepID=UPI0033D24570